MRKIIVIGESSLDIKFENGHPVEAHAGGIFLRTACALAKSGVKTLFISEIGMDAVGEMLISTLTDTEVDISCVDRFNGGLTSTRLKIGDDIVRYDCYPDGEGFDISWPRIEKDDIVVFGGYKAIDDRVRARLWALITNAVERKATIVYVPGVADKRVPRITRVMPVVFENLEVADIVVTLPNDLTALYGEHDSAKAFKNNISFYSRGLCALADCADNMVEVSSQGDAPMVDGKHDAVDAMVEIISQLP